MFLEEIYCFNQPPIFYEAKGVDCVKEKADAPSHLFKLPQAVFARTCEFFSSEELEAVRNTCREGKKFIKETLPSNSIYFRTDMKKKLIEYLDSIKIIHNARKYSKIATIIDAACDLTTWIIFKIMRIGLKTLKITRLILKTGTKTLKLALNLSTPIFITLFNQKILGSISHLFLKCIIKPFAVIILSLVKIVGRVFLIAPRISMAALLAIGLLNLVLRVSQFFLKTASNIPIVTANATITILKASIKPCGNILSATARTSASLLSSFVVKVAPTMAKFAVSALSLGRINL